MNPPNDRPPAKESTDIRTASEEELLAKLPDLASVLDVNPAGAADKLLEIPDESGVILRFVDGKRSLGEVLECVEAGRAEALQHAWKLFSSGLLIEGEERKKEASLRTTTPSGSPLTASGGVTKANGAPLAPLKQPRTKTLPMFETPPASESDSTSGEKPSAAPEKQPEPSSEVQQPAGPDFDAFEEEIFTKGLQDAETRIAEDRQISAELAEAPKDTQTFARTVAILIFLLGAGLIGGMFYVQRYVLPSPAPLSGKPLPEKLPGLPGAYKPSAGEQKASTKKNPTGTETDETDSTAAEASSNSEEKIAAEPAPTEAQGALPDDVAKAKSQASPRTRPRPSTVKSKPSTPQTSGTAPEVAPEESKPSPEGKKPSTGPSPSEGGTTAPPKPIETAPPEKPIEPPDNPAGTPGSGTEPTPPSEPAAPPSEAAPSEPGANDDASDSVPSDQPE